MCPTNEVCVLLGLHGSSIYKSNTELGPTWFDWRRRTNLITDYQMTCFRAYYLHLFLFISTFYLCQGSWYFCRPALQFLALLGPSRVQSRWTMFLGSLLVIPNNFSFHHHDEISLQNFSNTESRTYARTHTGKPVYRGGTGPPKNVFLGSFHLDWQLLFSFQPPQFSNT